MTRVYTHNAELKKRNFKQVEHFLDSGLNQSQYSRKYGFMMLHYWYTKYLTECIPYESRTDKELLKIDKMQAEITESYKAKILAIRAGNFEEAILIKIKTNKLRKELKIFKGI